MCTVGIRQSTLFDIGQSSRFFRFLLHRALLLSLARWNATGRAAAAAESPPRAAPTRALMTYRASPQAAVFCRRASSAAGGRFLAPFFRSDDEEGHPEKGPLGGFLRVGMPRPRRGMRRPPADALHRRHAPRRPRPAAPGRVTLGPGGRAERPQVPRPLRGLQCARPVLRPRALRGVAGRLLGVACVLLRRQTLFGPSTARRWCRRPRPSLGSPGAGIPPSRPALGRAPRASAALRPGLPSAEHRAQAPLGMPRSGISAPCRRAAPGTA
jgi:hypothetical protein